MSGEIAANVAGIRQRIAQAIARCGRLPHEVTLVAVTKGQPAERVRAAIAAGVRDVGENRMQEAQAKQRELADVRARWHFIGQLQTNKVKYLENRFSLVHSVDRPSLAVEISRRAVANGYVQAILVEVNIAREAGKAGVDPDQVPALCGTVAGLPGLRLAGLMAVPPAFCDAEQIRPYCRRLRALRDALVPGGELSMGMSSDFEVAIEEGATLVRIGRAIFGPREVG